ncbi:MAG TPA: condensation domain-containing protein, partial [Micromonospora sp.]
LSGPDTAGLRQVGRETGVAWPTLMISGIAAYLHLMTGRTDIVLGFAVSARTGRSCRTTPGMVSNTVPLRLSVRPETTLAELFAQVARETRRAVKHQRYRMEDLHRDLKLVGDRKRLWGPEINLLLYGEALSFAGHPAHVRGFSVGPEEDLSLIIDGRSGDDIRLDLHANPDLYTPDDLAGHRDRLLALLRSMASVDPTRPVALLDTVSPEERRVVSERAGHRRAVPESDLCALLAAGFEAGADQPAAVWRTAPVRRADLDTEANRLARLLISRGIGPGQTVAVVGAPSPDQLWALLAVLRSGAAFLLLDPAGDAARNAALLTAAAPRMALVTGSEPDSPLPAELPVFRLSGTGTAAELAGHPGHPVTDDERTVPLRPAHPAYLDHGPMSADQATDPGPLVVTHATAVARLELLRDRYAVRPTDRILYRTPPDWAASAWEALLALAVGATAVIAEPGSGADPAHLAALVDEEQVTVAYLGGRLLGGVLDAGKCSSLRQVVRGRDPVPPGLRGRLAAEPADPPTVAGTAYDGARVLDAAMRPVPPGVPGQLYLTGGLAPLGQVDRPAGSATRIVADPYGPPGSRMYATGQAATWQIDGTVVAVDTPGERYRADLEPLFRRPELADGAVVVRPDSTGDPVCLAYLVPARSRVVDPAVVADELPSPRPGHPVPSRLLVVPDLPLTPVGDLDLAALPVAESAEPVRSRAPLSPHEEAVRRLVAEVLARPTVEMTDDFFELGGQSLSAIRLASRIRSEFGVEISLRTVFERRTVADLAGYVAEATETRPPLRAGQRPDPVPRSLRQRGLWFINRTEGASGMYNTGLALRLAGELDPDALRRALTDVVRRHESLRTLFPEADGTPHQRILDPDGVECPVLTRTVDEAGLDQAITDAAAVGFDLEHDLPIRGHLFQLAPNEHVLLIVLHHIAADGWSLVPLARDFGTAYRARTQGRDPGLAPLELQYADYTVWQRRVLGDEDDPNSAYAKQLGYWKQALAGLPEELDLPFDRPRPAERTWTGGTVRFDLSPQTHRALSDLALRYRASMFMVLRAVVATVLTRTGAGTDIPLGMAVTGRTDDALDEVVGCFINTLVFRTDTSGSPSFAQLIDRVRDADLGAYANRDVPFHRLVEALNPERSLGRNPLFQVMMDVQEASRETVELPGLTVAPQQIEPGTAKVDLLFGVEEHRTADGSPGGVVGRLEYSLDLFERGTAEAMVRRLLRVVDAVLADPEQSIDAIEVLDPAERHKLLVGLNDTTRELPAGLLPGLFEAQVARTPDAPALLEAGTTVGYAELNARANRLAHLLVTEGVGPERLVALVLPRSTDLVVAMLAVLKAGAGYLPVDPDYPADRV